MRHIGRIGISLLGLCVAAGCRASTKVVEEPRADFHLTEGNRGYLVGTPPEAGPRKATRQVVEADIEVPSFGGGGTVASAPAPIQVPAAPSQDLPPEWPLDVSVGEPEFSAATSTSAEQYAVRPGDSLWSIAAKPEVFGDGNRWRDLYDANRDLLKQPADLRAGMTLRVPRTGSLGQAIPEPALSAEEQRFVK
jgi:hypothetical protein